VPSGIACNTGTWTWTTAGKNKSVAAQAVKYSNFSKQTLRFTGNAYVVHAGSCTSPVVARASLASVAVKPGYTATVNVKAPASHGAQCGQLLSLATPVAGAKGAKLTVGFSDPATPKLGAPVTVKNPSPMIALANTHYTRSGVCTVLMSPYPSYQQDVDWNFDGSLRTSVDHVKYWAGSSPYKIQQQDWLNSVRYLTWGWTGWLTYSAFTHYFYWPQRITSTNNHWTRMGAYYGSKYCFSDVSDGR